jgi:hypothetical protein
MGNHQIDPCVVLRALPHAAAQQVMGTDYYSELVAVHTTVCNL